MFFLTCCAVSQDQLLPKEQKMVGWWAHFKYSRRIEDSAFLEADLQLAAMKLATMINFIWKSIKPI